MKETTATAARAAAPQGALIQRITVAVMGSVTTETSDEVVLALSAACGRIRALLAEQSAAPMACIPDGFALVPMVMNREMCRVLSEDGWQWEDLLAAAESITEEQYNEIAAAPLPRASEQADEAVTELIAAADDVLRNGHQHDVGGGDVFLGTCDSTERLQHALDAIRTKEQPQ